MNMINPDNIWLKDAGKRMDKYEERRRKYPNAHPCHNQMYIGEAGLCLYMAEMFGYNTKKLRERFEMLKGEQNERKIKES